MSDIKLCSDCGIFTSKELIDQYKDRIEKLENIVKKLKNIEESYENVKTELKELKTINSYLLGEIKKSEKKRLFGIF